MKRELELFGVRHGVKIDYMESTPSTNDIAKNHLYGNGDVVIAASQSCGRGQRGNSWQSLPGKNLTFSLVLKPDFLPAEMQFLLSEAVALAMVNFLREYGIRAQVKWTNDIYVDGKKIAGILIENDVCGANLSRSIVGIGFNVNQTEFDNSLPNPTSLSLLTGERHNLSEVFEAIYSSLMNNFASLEQGYVSEIESHYHKSLYRRGKQHRYLTPTGESFMGTIERVEPTGELIVTHSDGTQRGYLFKEIEFTI